MDRGPRSEVQSSHSIVSDSLWPHELYSPWNSPGQNAGVGSPSLLQRIFPTQGLNPGLPHCRWILYQLSHKGSPRKMEWVAYPFSRRSSWPRDQTGVSCITGGFFTNWAMRRSLEATVSEIRVRHDLATKNNPLKLSSSARCMADLCIQSIIPFLSDTCSPQDWEISKEKGN